MCGGESDTTASCTGGSMIDALPLIVSVIIAVVGGLGGFAALMKVNADNSKTVSEGATNVVKMMRERMDEQELRLEALEGYTQRFDDWGDKVITLLNRAIESMTEPPRESFRSEAAAIAEGRPTRRRKDDHTASNVRKPNGS